MKAFQGEDLRGMAEPSPSSGVPTEVQLFVTRLGMLTRINNSN